MQSSPRLTDGVEVRKEGSGAVGVGSALVLSAPGAYSNSTLEAGGTLIQCRVLEPTSLAIKRLRESEQ